MTVRIDGEDGVSTGLILLGEGEGYLRVVLRSILVQDHGVPTQPGGGGGDGPGEGPGHTGQQGLGEHLVLKHQLR